MRKELETGYSEARAPLIWVIVIAVERFAKPTAVGLRRDSGTAGQGPEPPNVGFVR